MLRRRLIGRISCFGLEDIGSTPIARVFYKWSSSLIGKTSVSKTGNVGSTPSCSVIVVFFV